MVPSTDWATGGEKSLESHAQPSDLELQSAFAFPAEHKSQLGCIA